MIGGLHIVLVAIVLHYPQYLKGTDHILFTDSNWGPRVASFITGKKRFDGIFERIEICLKFIYHFLYITCTGGPLQ